MTQQHMVNGACLTGLLRSTASCQVVCAMLVALLPPFHPELQLP